MASVVTETNGRRLIQLSEGEHTQRPKIRLGKVTKRDAESARVHIEYLLRSKKVGSTMPPATADWLSNIPVSLRRRLENIQLVKPRLLIEYPTIAEFVRSYIQSRSDITPGSRRNLEQVEHYLIKYFGNTKRIHEITAGDADNFRIYLKTKGLAEATIRRHCKRARQYFSAAVKCEILSKNPFGEMKCGLSCNPERFYFVTREAIQKILDVCPDNEWRLIFALARYGGLRMPSEAFLLKWADVNFDKMRFTVRSPKTKHQGKASRTVPIFPELYPLLLNAFEQAEEGAEYVIRRYRDPKQNLRTQAHHIIRRAGLEPWPKTFQNMRSTRETELAEEYPVQVVCAWIGNSPQVAAKHYLQVTEDHFQKAVQNPVQTTQEKRCQEVSENQAAFEERTQVIDWHLFAKSCIDNSLQSLPPRGLEPLSPG